MEGNLEKERRVFERIEVALPATLVVEEESFPVEVKEVSAEGLTIFSPELLREGVSLQLQFCLSDCKNALSVEGETVWGQALSKDKWRIGIKLSKPDLVRLVHLLRLQEEKEEEEK